MGEESVFCSNSDGRSSIASILKPVGMVRARYCNDGTYIPE